ncbi:SCO family protein [Limnohabitans sp. T6-20]|uniref:SCO family protein n=1 Tax=Limnohabitans sp. T6-20 TaxID=1100725 RepID=UPI000D39F66D|nr:SCO family protein [Limnohabitans sp. T6-20]PUE08088.1 SCO family protein [Limnohabitans sp. T6-20]
MNKRQWLGVLSLSVLLGLTGCGKDKPAFKGVDITGADYAQGWELTDHNGQVRTLKDFAGKAVVVFFGYTQCPDVCPTALQEMVEAKQLLGADADKLQGVFITVDPERDTPELLKAYMANFGPDFVALHPTPEQLPKVTKDFKIYYKKVEGKTPTSYTMDHSAGSFTFDPQGRVRLYNRHGSGAAALADDVRMLLKGQ